jgi:DNA-binding transcriptional LysR family regulator
MCATRSPPPSVADTEIRLLRVFDAVVRHKGFAAAQDELGVTQATISNQISHLEQRLGVRLCERGRSGFYLTEQGAAIHEAALNLMRSVENFRSIVGSVRGELIGEVQFGTVDAMYTNKEVVLEDALRSFARQAPKVVVHIDIASPQDLVQGLLDDRFHLVLTPMQRFPKPLRAEPLFEERQSLYCGRGHALFDLPDQEIRADDLAEHPYAARSYMQDWAGPRDIVFQSVAITSHMESLALLILSGRFIGYLPNHFAEQWIGSGAMRCLLNAEISYSDSFYLAHRQRERNAAARLLRTCMKGLFPEDPRRF